MFSFFVLSRRYMRNLTKHVKNLPLLSDASGYAKLEY